jgi:spore maturation protein SpmA
VLPVQGSAQDVENARVALVFALAGIMMFWRFLLRIALAAVAVAIVVGASVLLQGMHH